MSCCIPKIYTVRCVALSGGTTIVTLNGRFADIGQNSSLLIAFMPGTMPLQTTAPVVFVDTAGVVLPGFAGDTGNLLRTDALRKLLKHLACLGDVPAVLRAFRGSDPAHISILHRMCPSDEAIAEESPHVFMAERESVKKS